jgi:hypothetical protein
MKRREAKFNFNIFYGNHTAKLGIKNGEKREAVLKVQPPLDMLTLMLSQKRDKYPGSNG